MSTHMRLDFKNPSPISKVCISGNPSLHFHDYGISRTAWTLKIIFSLLVICSQNLKYLYLSDFLFDAEMALTTPSPVQSQNYAPMRIPFPA